MLMMQSQFSTLAMVVQPDRSLIDVFHYSFRRSVDGHNDIWVAAARHGDAHRPDWLNCEFHQFVSLTLWVLGFG